MIPERPGTLPASFAIVKPAPEPHELAVCCHAKCAMGWRAEEFCRRAATSLSWNCDAAMACTNRPATSASGLSGRRATGLTLQSSGPPEPVLLRKTMISTVYTRGEAGVCPDVGATTAQASSARSGRRRKAAFVMGESIAGSFALPGRGFCRALVGERGRFVAASAQLTQELLGVREALGVVVGLDRDA